MFATTGLPASVDVDSVCTASSGWPSSALSLASSGDGAALDGHGLVLGGGESQVGLHHLQPRRVAAVESRLRGVAHPVRQIALLAQDPGSGIGKQDVVVRAANVVANLGDDCRELGVAGANGRFTNGDPLGALTAQFERHGKAERLFGRLLFDFDAGFRVEPFARDG